MPVLWPTGNSGAWARPSSNTHLACWRRRVCYLTFAERRSFAAHYALCGARKGIGFVNYRFGCFLSPVNYSANTHNPQSAGPVLERGASHVAKGLGRRHLHICVRPNKPRQTRCLWSCTWPVERGVRRFFFFFALGIGQKIFKQKQLELFLSQTCLFRHTRQFFKIFLVLYLICRINTCESELNFILCIHL